MENQNKELRDEPNAPSKEIAEFIANQKEAIANMGGIKAAQARLELTKTLLLHRKKAKTPEGVVKKILKEFKEAVAEQGFWGIQEYMIPIVLAFGNTTEKTTLIINAYWDMSIWGFGVKPLMTREQFQDTKMSIFSVSLPETKKARYCSILFDTMRVHYPHVKGLADAILLLATRARANFDTYFWIETTQNLIGRLPEEEQTKLLEDLFTLLKVRDYSGVLDSSTDLETIKDNLIKNSILAIKEFEYRVTEFKGLKDGMERWIEENKAKALLPMKIRKWLDGLKDEVAKITQSYTKSYINKLKEEGKSPTETELLVAIFPDWDDIEMDEETSNYYHKLLNEQRDRLK